MATVSAEHAIGQITALEPEDGSHAHAGQPLRVNATARIEAPSDALESFVFKLAVSCDEQVNVRQATLKRGQGGELTSPLTIDVPANPAGIEVRIVLSAEGTATGNTFALDQRSVHYPAE